MTGCGIYNKAINVVVLLFSDKFPFHLRSVDLFRVTDDHMGVVLCCRLFHTIDQGIPTFVTGFRKNHSDPGLCYVLIENLPYKEYCQHQQKKLNHKKFYSILFHLPVSSVYIFVIPVFLHFPACMGLQGYGS